MPRSLVARVARSLVARIAGSVAARVALRSLVARIAGSVAARVARSIVGRFAGSVAARVARSIVARIAGSVAARVAMSIVVLALTATTARAEEGCTGITASGGRFATCFDTGNRLSITAGSDGFGGSVAVRHVVSFEDEPDLVWKLEHVAGDATHAGFEDRFSAVVYRGRFVRHARDGHIVLPLGVPKKIFLPFDIGALAEVGRVRWRPTDAGATVGIVKMAALIDLARTRGFRRRFAFGPVARWDLDTDRQLRSVGGHLVAPFSMGMVNVFLESANGRMSGDFRVEAGSVWHSDVSWAPQLLAEATLERIVLAVNDRPVALVAGVRYESATDEAIARVGARIVLFDRRDPRVQLDTLRRHKRR